MKYYIAYGSNMSFEQMTQRCPDAEFVGVGELSGMTLEFYRHATVQSSESKADKVPVAVWKINENDEATLDIYEGVPTYYIKCSANVRMGNGKHIRGMLYIMTPAYRVGSPTAEYIDGIVDGYNDCCVANLISTVVTPAVFRCERRKATGKTNAPVSSSTPRSAKLSGLKSEYDRLMKEARSKKGRSAFEVQTINDELHAVANEIITLEESL